MKNKRFNKVLTAFIAFGLICIAFAIGWKIARAQTIKSARLSWTGSESYGIAFDGEEHAYYDGEDYYNMLMQWSHYYGEK